MDCVERNSPNCATTCNFQSVSNIEGNSHSKPWIISNLLLMHKLYILIFIQCYILHTCQNLILVPISNIKYQISPILIPCLVTPMGMSLGHREDRLSMRPQANRLYLYKDNLQYVMLRSLSPRNRHGQPWPGLPLSCMREPPLRKTWEYSNITKPLS
jgi:hypothetical protein